MSRDVSFSIGAADYSTHSKDIHSIRDAVFIEEQQVAAELEHDGLDESCYHVLAWDAQGSPVGTARLNSERKIERMAVSQLWRNKGVGQALLRALLDEAQRLKYEKVTLHAQLAARNFYAKAGFVPTGPHFVEANIEHQSMQRCLQGAESIVDRDAATASFIALINQAKRGLAIYTRVMDPGILDNASVLKYLREFAVRPGRQLCILLQDASSPQMNNAPLISLGQRLPSTILFHETVEQVDREDHSAFIVNDLGGYYFRPMGHRYEGSFSMNNSGRGLQYLRQFGEVWKRSRECNEYRVLGI